MLIEIRYIGMDTENRPVFETSDGKVLKAAYRMHKGWKRARKIDRAIAFRSLHHVDNDGNLKSEADISNLKLVG